VTAETELGAEAASRRLPVVNDALFPAYVVWELTLACDHACRHCGSRAIQARDGELTTTEALEVVEQLAEMGAREVVLIGGEAYLHDGFLTIIRALAAAGITPTMTTGGLGVDDALAREMAQAGIRRVSVSVDGLGATHDRIRARKNSFESAMGALRALKNAGLYASANTHVNRVNQGDLEGLYLILRDAGVRSWQVQLTVPLGRAADRPNFILQPYELMEVVPRIAALKRRGLREGLLIMPGNNLGYFGPEEGLLRSQKPDDRDCFRGCQAGRFVLGIESHGDVKGCPSLQSDAYVGGNLRESPLQTIWDQSPRLAFARQRTTADLWGYCAQCPFAETCMGGCSFTAHALFGRPGNNPYCHYRARALAKEGLRERLVQTVSAPGVPFDHGRFELVVEASDSPSPPVQDPLARVVKIQGPGS